MAMAFSDNVNLMPKFPNYFLIENIGFDFKLETP